MAVTREQFEAGMTYDAYKAQMTRNKEQVEQNEKDVQLKADDVQAVRNLPAQLRFDRVDHLGMFGKPAIAIHRMHQVAADGDVE